MTKKDFFRVIIKLFGLYSLILSIFYFIPSNIPFIYNDFDLSTIIWFLGILSFLILIYSFLIKNVDSVINTLKLDKGFDDDKIEFGNFDSYKILKLSFILIGAFLIIDFLPEFLQYLFLAFKKDASPNGLNYVDTVNFGNTIDYFNWGISGINIILGYLILTNYNGLAKWMNKNTNNQ